MTVHLVKNKSRHFQSQHIVRTYLYEEMSTPQLPTPRDLLTSMIDINTDIPHAPGNSNAIPLALPLSTRPILTTLHVLYPGLLLPALDLLDKSLVTHIRLRPVPDSSKITPEEQRTEAEGEVIGSSPPIIPTQHTYVDELRIEGQSIPSSLYIVRSSQDTRSRSRRQEYAPPTTQCYVVRLSAWNCDCAAFAYNSFPPATSARSWGERRLVVKDIPTSMKVLLQDDTCTESNDTWRFGGRSLDRNRNTDSVPCCKHLLACILADRWRDVFGKYVTESEVDTAEMAGLGAGEW